MHDNFKVKKMKDLNRLFKPKSIAVVGGGSWCESVIKQLKKIKFNGEIWPIHPKRESISGIKSLKNI